MNDEVFFRDKILTHRGLEPSKNKFFTESSYEAFQDHLSRGFGIEFDVNFTKNGPVICHDSNLNRLTLGKDSRHLQELTIEECLEVKLPNGSLCALEDILGLIDKSTSRINALHMKGKYQKKRNLEVLIDCLKKFSEVFSKLFVFDLKPEFAAYIKKELPTLQLAASVSHSYDIKRFNEAVSGTLLSVEEVLGFRDLYDWVWLDEWDRQDENGRNKKLYRPDFIHSFREAGFNIALVTPELHSTSPHLLGGECHGDAINQERLFSRILEILHLDIDVVCTDYPEEVVKLLDNSRKNLKEEERKSLAFLASYSF
jgi:hypothetical protein